MNGEEVKHSFFPGKMRVVGFLGFMVWSFAFWEMLNVHKAYDLLHDKGFEIISISTDRKKPTGGAMKEKQMGIS